MAKNKTIVDDTKIVKRAKQITSRENGALGGRPKGAVSDLTRMKREMRKQLTEKVNEHFSSLMQAAIDLANGITIEEEETDSSGQTKTRIYRKPPNTEMLKFLVEQNLGKATQTIDAKIEDRRALSVQEIEALGAGEIELHEDGDDDLEEED